MRVASWRELRVGRAGRKRHREPLFSSITQGARLTKAASGPRLGRNPLCLLVGFHYETEVDDVADQDRRQDNPPDGDAAHQDEAD